MTFYKEWLSLEKSQFRIMAMLADKGKYIGNLGELCNYFFVSQQQRNREKLKLAIDELANQKYLKYSKKGNTWTIEATPKEEGKAIVIEEEWYKRIRQRSSQGGRSVSWEVLLKVLLWACNNSYDEIITNREISNDVKISQQQISAAKAVLDEEFGAIIRKRISVKTGDDVYKNLGQHLGATAFWKD